MCNHIRFRPPKMPGLRRREAPGADMRFILHIFWTICIVCRDAFIESGGCPDARLVKPLVF